MIANAGNEEGKMHETMKMKKLFDLLTNPYSRASMETLELCGKALEKMEKHWDKPLGKWWIQFLKTSSYE